MEDRLNKLQIANNTASWGKEQLRILRDMLDDRILDAELRKNHPLSINWVSSEINRIIQGIEIV